MERYLVDTSAWINFLNDKNKNSPKNDKFKQLISNGELIYLCPVIKQEILQGIKDDSYFAKISHLLSLFPVINTDILEVTDYAISLFRSLRKQGVTIRKSADCLIASYALINDLVLLHDDIDFNHISTKTNLRSVNCC